jgi:FkbM family methyltransferase
MNKEKFEKLITIIEKSTGKGHFTKKNKIKDILEALFIRLRQNFLDILFWPLYFLHLFLLTVEIKLFRDAYTNPIRKLRSFLINGFIKENIYEFERTLYFTRINSFIKFLKDDEKLFVKSFLDYVVNDGEKTAAREILSIVRDIIIKDQYYAKEFIKNGYCVLDCGANFGIFSLYAAYLNENGKIYAIEPVKETADIMQRLLDFFEVKNVKIIRKAVGDEKKKAFINVVPYQLSLISSTLLDVNYGKKEEIEVDTIDNIVKEEKIERVDFIKMDIEGYERYALKGAIETIKKHKPIIVVSAYHLADDKKVLPEIVKSAYANYEVKLVKEGDEDFIFIPKRTS